MHISVVVMKQAVFSLRWRHNRRDSVSNHQPHDCLLNRLFRRRSKKTSKLRVTGLCAGNSPGTGEFPAQMASNAENVSIWWRHHVQSWRGRLPETLSSTVDKLQISNWKAFIGNQYLVTSLWFCFAGSSSHGVKAVCILRPFNLRLSGRWPWRYIAALFY